MLPTWYKQYKDFIEESLEKYLEAYFERHSYSAGWAEFKEAILYAVAWWKKLRAILALEFYLVLQNKSLSDLMSEIDFKNNNIPDILRLCLAIEFVHSYSLVHDDLPCMDNDILRRGQPTVWKKYWEHQAVLVWDTLNSLSFEILSEIQNPALSVKLSSLLSRAVSFHGMIGWQVDDMYFEQNCEKMSVSDLTNLHNKKTWALIKLSVQGGILISWKVEFLHTISWFGEKLWLAFQIKDDLLDVEWTVEQTGKSVGWEQKGFVHFMWINSARAKLTELIDDCLVTAKLLKSDHISFLVDYVGKRVK